MYDATTHYCLQQALNSVFLKGIMQLFNSNTSELLRPFKRERFLRCLSSVCRNLPEI